MNLRESLSARPDLQYLLFRRGYLVTRGGGPKAETLQGWPFFGQWEKTEWGGVTY